MVHSASAPEIMELRISACGNPRYFESKGVTIPEIWMRLLSWVSSCHVEPMKDNATAGDASSVCKEEDDQFMVAKTRGRKWF